MSNIDWTAVEAEIQKNWDENNPNNNVKIKITPPVDDGKIYDLEGRLTPLLLEKFVEKVDESTIHPLMLNEIQRLKNAGYQEGDTIWFYKDFGFLSGWAGYVLMRGDKFVSRIVTMMS